MLEENVVKAAGTATARRKKSCANYSRRGVQASAAGYAVSDDVFELYRIYFGLRGSVMVVLLCGGDKSSQDRDIEKAKTFWADWKRRQP
jgi:hypothetical protein